MKSNTNGTAPAAGAATTSPKNANANNAKAAVNPPAQQQETATAGLKIHTAEENQPERVQKNISVEQVLEMAENIGLVRAKLEKAKDAKKKISSFKFGSDPNAGKITLSDGQNTYEIRSTVIVAEILDLMASKVDAFISTIEKEIISLY